MCGGRVLLGNEALDDDGRFFIVVRDSSSGPKPPSSLAPRPRVVSTDAR